MVMKNNTHVPTCVIIIKFILKSVKSKSAYCLLNDKLFIESFKFFWKSFKETKTSFKSLQQW